MTTRQTDIIIWFVPANVLLSQLIFSVVVVKGACEIIFLIVFAIRMIPTNTCWPSVALHGVFI